MSQTFQYPGSVFVGPPSVEVKVPDSWVPVFDPATVFIARNATAEDGKFASNVTIQHVRFGAGYTLAQATAVVDHALEALPDFQDGGRDSGEQFGVPTYIREGAFVHAEAGTLVQHVRIFLIENGPFVDVIQTTGTVSGLSATQELPAVREVADSVRVSAPTSA